MGLGLETRPFEIQQISEWQYVYNVQGFGHGLRRPSLSGLVGFECGNPRLKSWAIVGRPRWDYALYGGRAGDCALPCFGASVAKRCRHRELPIEPPQPMDLVSELEKGTGFQPSLCFSIRYTWGNAEAFPQAGMKPRRWR